MSLMTIHVGFLLFPKLTQLDATGPVQVLSRVPGVTIHLVWKATGPVETDAGFSLIATDSFESCPELDVLCVPGGAGHLDCLKDEAVLRWLRQRAETAKYVTSVCTGSLLLGAAGLLDGYEAACHWAFRDFLSCYGAVPRSGRVVRDRNRITGGGVTAGIDFGLTLAAELAGEEVARLIQLGLEYNPAPPFDSGSPEAAGNARVAAFRARIAPLLEQQRALSS